MSYRAIPLLIVALLVYNLIVFLHPGTAPDAIFYGSASLDTTTNKLVTHSADIFHLKMPNAGADGEEWHFTFGDLMLLLGFVLLTMEVVKAAYMRGGALTDQALSTVLLVVFLVEFLLVPQAHTALFLLLTLMSAFDVIVGAIIGIRTARQNIGFNGPNN
jgi:hypothetical protein